MSTILIVDDDSGSRDTLQSMLESRGYALISASSGAEALSLAEITLPDIILLDIMMPGMDGYEVCRRIRQQPTLAEVPVVMLTALDDRSARLEGIESGADDFLTKPVDRQELIARVNTIIRLNRYRTLLNQREDLRKMAQRVLAAQEHERRRISRELHDDLGQALTALLIGLRNIKSDIPTGNEDLHHRISELIASTDETLEKVRHLAQDLRPPVLDTLGLRDAMEVLCEKFSQLSGLQVNIEIAPEIPPSSNLLEITIYRILQESLTNIAKHAHANRVWVETAIEDGFFNLTVQDDGIGFVPEESSGDGMGLSGMYERLELVSGQMDIRSKHDRGTVLAVKIPLDTSLNDPAEDN